ncbi:MAG: hypothetical protein K2I36_01200, partial [Ureaplasma sp.]|nr:hypothetical protein [Ureaplasma sp.]
MGKNLMHSKVLENNEQISIFGDVLFHINRDLLLQLYLPIIGNDALYLYDYLWNIKRINTTSGMNSCSNVQKLQKLLNCSITTLLNNLNKLSAINLIQIFSNGAKLIIKLFPPLEYSEFI